MVDEKEKKEQEEKGKGGDESKLSVVKEDEMEFGELLYFGMIVEIKGKDFLKLDKEKFKLIKLGTKEEIYKTEKGDALYLAKRWGILIPKGKEKEFVKLVKDKWVLPDELADYL